jgi:hypothetical protein
MRAAAVCWSKRAILNPFLRPRRTLLAVQPHPKESDHRGRHPTGPRKTASEIRHRARRRLVLDNLTQFGQSEMTGNQSSWCFRRYGGAERRNVLRGQPFSIGCPMPRRGHLDVFCQHDCCRTANPPVLFWMRQRLILVAAGTFGAEYVENEVSAHPLLLLAAIKQLGHSTR